MKDLLFGWLAKNQFELTGYDSIIITIECIILFIIGGLIWFVIDYIKEKKEKKRSNK